jgi:hypothetical protein
VVAPLTVAETSKTVDVSVADAPVVEDALTPLAASLAGAAENIIGRHAGARYNRREGQHA